MSSQADTNQASEDIDDILFDLCDLSYASFTTQEEADRVADQLDYDRAKAKQALTSLIKELVAEAKPGKYSSGESILNVDGIGEVDGYEGYNQAIDRFEQNLLKELENGNE